MEGYGALLGIRKWYLWWFLLSKVDGHRWNHCFASTWSARLDVPCRGCLARQSVDNIQQSQSGVRGKRGSWKWTPEKRTSMEHPWKIWCECKCAFLCLFFLVGTFHINMVLSCCCEKPPHQVSLGLRSHWWIDQEVGFHLDGLDLDATHQAIRGWAGRIVLEKLNPWWNFLCDVSGVKGWWSDNHNYGKTRHKVGETNSLYSDV